MTSEIILLLPLSGTTKITATVDVVRVLGICPNDEAVMPIKANRFYMTKELKVVNY